VSLSNRYKTILRKDITMDLKKSLAFFRHYDQTKKIAGNLDQTLTNLERRIQWN
jgi:hypothetical protein